jgi:hypothetical protein
MTNARVDVHELIAWELDEYPYRNAATNFKQEALAAKVKHAQDRLAEREFYVNNDAFLVEETHRIQHLLSIAGQRGDLQQEYKRLDWKLGVVDLRCLLAFQRRLVFSPAWQALSSPRQDEWPELISHAIGRPRGTEHVVVRNCCVPDSLDISLQSNNPDLQLQLEPETRKGELLPLSLYGGSPFFEVAEFRGRWFLRDGYHRAYRLLRAGVHCMPAVVIYARSIEELGATEPWFFNEEQLFSDRPPRVADFLDENMVMRYERTALRKVIRVRIEESLEPFDESEDAQGEKL